MKTTDCRSQEGITIGLIDSILSISRVLSKRNFNTKPIKEALKDLIEDEDLKSILNKKSEIIELWTGQKGGGPFSTPQKPKKNKVKTISELGLDRIRNRIVLEHENNLGSYGMGGYGCFGLKLDKTDEYDEEYLVLRLHGALDYIKINGVLAGKLIDQVDISDNGFLIMGIEPGQTRDLDRFESFSITNKKDLPLDSWLDAWVISPKRNLYG